MASGIPVRCAHTRIVGTDTLRPNPANPYQHGDEQMRLLAKSIVLNGWREAITVSLRSGLIVAGEGRWRAALAAGLAEVPIDEQSFESDDDEVTWLIAHNRLSDLRKTDYAALTERLVDLDAGQMDPEATGYSEAELHNLLATVWDPPHPASTEERARTPRTVTCPSCGTTFIAGD
jgi:ParB family chromosome partitioning protein